MEVAQPAAPCCRSWFDWSTRSEQSVFAMDRAAFAELLEEARARPRMWLPDERYTTLVAFVTGCDAASGQALLYGFNEWLAAFYLCRPTSVAWWGQVGDRITPDHPESRRHYGDLDEEASRPLNAELFDRLLEFLNVPP